MSKKVDFSALDQFRKIASDIEDSYNASSSLISSKQDRKSIRLMDDAVNNSYPLFASLLPIKLDRSEQYKGDKNLVTYSFLENLHHSGYLYANKEFLYHNCFMDFFTMDPLKKSCIEVELKVSRSDYLKDFEKKIDVGGTRRNKHVLLAKGQLFVKQFYFLMPERMAAAVEIPDHCGLIYFREMGGKSQRRSVSFQLIRNAPLLHTNEPPDTIWQHIADRLYSQLHSIRRKHQSDYFTNQPSIIKL